MSRRPADPADPTTLPDEPADPAAGSAPPAADGGPGRRRPDATGAAQRANRLTGRGRRLARRALPGLVSMVVVVAVFWFFLPQFTSVSAIWATIRQMTWLEMALLLLAALWNFATYSFGMVDTMPGLTYPQAAVVTQATTALSNTVPGGSAAGVALAYTMFWSWGFSRSRSSVSLLVSGFWNNFVKLGMPIVALALLALRGPPSTGRVIAALFGLGILAAAIAIFVAALRSEPAAHRIGLLAGRLVTALRGWVHRPPVRGWELATVRFRARTVVLLRARWLWITVSTLVSHLSLYGVLLAALRTVDVTEAEVGWIEVLAVYSFGRLLTAVPITPGGLGLVDVSLIAGLAAAGGPRPQVAAAVLIFRALTYVLPIPLGVLAYVYWRRNRSWRRAPGQAPRTALVPENA